MVLFLIIDKNYKSYKKIIENFSTYLIEKIYFLQINYLRIFINKTTMIYFLRKSLIKDIKDIKVIITTLQI